MTATAILGLLIGLLLGLLGGGGSVLAIPALVYVAGLPLSAAVPTSLLVVGVSSLTAVLGRVGKHLVAWRIAALLAGAGTGTAFLGSAVNRLLDPRVVLAGFAVVLVAAALRMLWGQRPGSEEPAAPRLATLGWRGGLLIVGAGLLVGFLTGLFGVGEGFLLVPTPPLLRLSMPAAVATSLVVIAVNSAAAYAAYAGNAAVDYRIAAVITGAAVTGSLLSTRLASRLPARRLSRLFALLLLTIAAFVIVQVVVNPGAAA